MSPATAQGNERSIRITPAVVQGTLASGLRLGPIAAFNTTGAPYELRVFGVLLSQARDGGISILETRHGLARARRLLAIRTGRSHFPDGAVRLASARVGRLPRDAGLYGGIVFQATPAVRTGQITSILRLTARVLLDPRPRFQRVRWRGGRIRVEQAGQRRLNLFVPVRNRGNVFRRVGGSVLVRDARGRRVARVPLTSVEILPRALVDLRASLTRSLAPGRYTLLARMSGAGRRFRARGSMTLYGVSQVRSADATISSFDPPTAYRGRDTAVEATFRNTGNVPYAPAAELQVRRLAGGGTGALLQTVRLGASTAAPGQTGKLVGKVSIPAGTFDLHLRLLQDGRELDARSVSVTPQARPALPTRVKNFVTDHAVVIVAALLGILLLAAALGVGYLRRLKAAAAASQRPQADGRSA